MVVSELIKVIVEAVKEAPPEAKIAIGAVATFAAGVYLGAEIVTKYGQKEAHA